MSIWDDWFRRRRRWSIFDDVDKIFEEMFKESLDTLPKEMYKERTLPDGSKVRTFGPVVYGYSMTMGPDGKPVIREFGNIKPSSFKGLPATGEQREPLVDVVTGDEMVQVLAEVPGVEKENINLSATQNNLIISVHNELRKYYKEIPLPTEVDPDSAKATYKNGVLEVSLKKKERKKPEGRKIGIE